MTDEKRAYLELHFIVFLYGFTGILGKLISLSELVLVWWRMALAALGFLLFWNLVKPIFKKENKSLILKLVGIGILVALHWVTFFGSVKYSNVSVALVCFATTTFFTAVFEPLLLKKQFNWYELGLGFLIIPGMYFVVNGIDVSMFFGVFIGIISSMLAAIFSILNKQLADQAHPMGITMVELTSGWVFLTLLLPFYFMYDSSGQLIPSGWEDILYLLILAWVCTTFAYSVNLRVLKHISAFSANLTIALEPIYSIIFAILIFKEHQELSSTFYIGVVIMMLAVFGHPILKNREQRDKSRDKN